MISKEEVKHIAKLARLELTEKEIEKMQKNLSGVLDYANLLKKADTSKIKSKTEYVAIEKSTRKDEVKEKNSSMSNNLISAAPDKKDDYIKVKQIL